MGGEDLRAKSPESRGRGRGRGRGRVIGYLLLGGEGGGREMLNFGF
jgi:hypothetical protein